MPAAKQQPLAAVVKAAARSCRSRHPQIPSNGKSPDVVPGGVDIAIVSPNVSSCSLRKFTTQPVACEKGPYPGRRFRCAEKSRHCEGKQSKTPAVIASEAKQSIFLSAALWIASLRSQ